MLQKMIISFILLSVVSDLYAEVPLWKINTKASSLSFTATQNNAPVTGSFANFSGEIKFDPAQLSASQVHIIIDMDSVTASNADVANSLKTEDWFNPKSFPKSEFSAEKFTKIAEHTFQAEGKLTLRDKSLPVVLKFDLDKFTQTEAHAKGSASLQRTQFGVGQGEFASTDDVKDLVSINFEVVATK